MSNATFWATFAGAFIAVLVVGCVATVRLMVLRHRHALRELRQSGHSYRLPAPWWRIWNRRPDSWNSAIGGMRP